MKATNKTNKGHKETVFVGLSGGVDSSWSAYLLKKSGYRVVGVYLKNWTKDLAGFDCPWREDYLAAKQLATQLKIEFRVYDFQKSYQRLVVEEMIAQYQAGQTPNPDINCNRFIKFRLFYQAALEDGADWLATGHYAKTDGQFLFAADDKTKDQSYFLYAIEQKVLKKVIWPLATWQKKDVRQAASRVGLANAQRPDSQGICFVGQVGIRDFLKEYVSVSSGAIIEADSGQVLGEHQGAIFYTIGQRQGLGIGSRPNKVGPYYVVDKDMAKNEVYVSQQIDHQKIWCREVYLTGCRWIGQPAKKEENYLARFHHLGRLLPAKIDFSSAKNQIKVLLEEPQRAVTLGQSLVLYENDGQRLVGGGLIGRQI